jgi:hypothetical protein
VTWWKFKYVVGKTSDSHDRKVFRVKYSKTKSNHFRGYLKPKLKEFVTHNFISKSYVLVLPPNTILSCIDFSKNYAFKVQNEIQDMH